MLLQSITLTTTPPWILPFSEQCNTDLLKDNNAAQGKSTEMKATDFGLVSLFNGISTFVNYLMSKLFSKNNSSRAI